MYVTLYYCINIVLGIHVKSPPPATFVYNPKGAECTMTGFEECQINRDEWFSPHFYTHPNGYKMSLNVYPNGGGSGKKTHLSMYLYLSARRNCCDHINLHFSPGSPA
jgi:hypothetical protein